jgi:hypothetical protein
VERSHTRSPSWRDRTSSERAARTTAEHDLSDLQTLAQGLEASLAVAAHDKAIQADDAAIATVQREAARQAADRLGLCTTPTSSDCRAAIVNASAVLKSVAGSKL